MISADTFEQAVNEAVVAEGEEKQRLLQRAVELYEGELLPLLLNGEQDQGCAWLFRNAATALCAELLHQRRYNELLAVATGASQVSPLEEEYHTYLFRALQQLKMYRAIIPAYHKTSRLFREELGIAPCEEIRQIYEAANAEVGEIERDVLLIREDLREATATGGTAGGPFFCSYDVFKYLFQVVSRSAERSGDSVVVLLVSLRGKDGSSPEAKQLSGAMNQLKDWILSGLLRKSDTVARYSKSQFIIMLSMNKEDGAAVVIERIRSRCQPQLDPAGLQLLFTTTQLEPLG